MVLTAYGAMLTKARIWIRSEGIMALLPELGFIGVRVATVMPRLWRWVELKGKVQASLRDQGLRTMNGISSSDDDGLCRGGGFVSFGDVFAYCDFLDETGSA
jgi:hypothetical protein